MDQWNALGEMDWKQRWLKEEEIRADTQCSFCGKRRDQVSRLTVGPGKVYICDECVDLYREHIAKTQYLSPLKEKIFHTCTSCGTRAPVSHRYCYNCGALFEQETGS